MRRGSGGVGGGGVGSLIQLEFIYQTSDSAGREDLQSFGTHDIVSESQIDSC